MSRHKRNFHCFNAVGGEGSHTSSLPFEHHTPRQPRIPQRDIATYYELEQDCYLCSAYRHAQTVEDAENQLLPLYHTHTPFHHHPQRYVLRGPNGFEETHSGNHCHSHQQRYNKKIVLVKNSDPSFRKTIILHSRGLCNFGLFLEEVSDLMQYHTRKLYTQDGCKVDSVQSLLHCPGVLICVGREPSHPLIMENFEKTSTCKLPKLSGKPSASERTDRNERLAAKTSIILPNLEGDKRATKYSVSSDKSAPDGRDSPDVISCSNSGDSIREDDIEKRVRVNKDGSLSMEMKVRFRLPNDETLHWSTKVKKTAGRTGDHIKGHTNPNLAQISDVSCSESEIMSADDAYFTQHYQAHKDKPHCPYCCSNCQGYETSKNVPETHGASRCSQTSSSSASSHTVVSRKTVIERKTMSRSSEELADHVVETCITQSIKAAETMELCTIQRETCSPKCNVKPSNERNGESTGVYNLQLKTAQKANQEEQQAGSATCASQMFTGDEEKDAQISDPDRKETTGSNVFDTGLFIPHLSPVSKERASKSSGHHTKPNTSKPSYICRCGEAADVQIKPKDKIKTKAAAEGELQRDKSSAKSVESDASCRSNKFEEIPKIERLEEGRRSTSAVSFNSNTPTNCNSAVSDITTEELQADHDKETPEGTSGRISVKSFKSSKSVETPPVEHESEEAEDDSELRTQSSLSALSSVSAELKNIAQEESEEEDNQNAAEENGEDYEPRVKSVISEKSASRKSRASESVTKENLMDNQAEWGARPSSISATSRKSTVSPTSRTSPRLEETSMRGTSALSTKSNVSIKSKESKTTKKANDTENDNTEGESELRSQSKLSVKSERSVKSNLSAKSSKSKTSQEAHNESCNEMKDDYCSITERPDSAEARASSVVSEKSVGSQSVTPTKPNVCRDNMATEERAGSVISVKSSKLDTSKISLKSETSQVSATHNGDLCGERNELHATAGRSSCMSDKSMKSNISARSNKSKGCDKLDKDDALSVKSTQSTLSKTSAKSNPSQTSDADETEQRQRAPSNLSTASTKSSVSHASAGCAKEKAPEVCCDPSEGIFSEEEIEGRSVSSMSVQSVRSNISSRSSRSSCSTRPLAAEGTESFPQDSEEIQTEIRAASSTSVKSAELQKVRSESAMSAISTKSTKSNTSTMCSSIRPGEDANEEAIEERVPSVLSVKSTKSATSTKSTKSKCSIDALQQKHSKASNQEMDKELLQERPPSRGSPVSERSAKSAERPHSALSAKSKVSDAELVTAARPSDDGDYEDEAEPRAQSALSTKTANSITSAKSSNSTEHDSLHDNKSNHGEMMGRASSNMSARSEKSTKSNASTVSKRSKIAAGCLEGVYPEERVVEGESESRLMSPNSADSISSTKSNKSMHPATSEVEDDSLASEGEKHEEHNEERPPSTMSVKSTQSCMSEISTKSAERTPSSLSAKSGKSSTPKICSGKCPGESNILEETETRAESGLSCKTERSASSAKSTPSKGLDCHADESTVDDDEHVGRATSNLSSKSEKSTKSNGSKGGKRLKVSKICLEHEAADPIEKAAENGREDISFSHQSVRSKASVKSNKLKSCVDIAVAKNSDISDKENDTETNIERAESSMSTTSVQSSVSEMSFKSEERAASALSEKSHASMISDMTNVSEVPSGRAALLDEVDSEDEERTPSVMSVKSTNSSISNKSSKSVKLDDEKQRKRSSSNLSVKSGRSAKSNISKRSDACDILSENCADSCDVRIVEGESEGSTISVVSAQSVKSQSERFGYDSLENEEHKRPPSSSSAKSVLSHVSEKSAKSADRPASALSAKSTKSCASAKSICSEISDAKSGKTVEIYDGVTESQERTNSALSSKTAQSAISTKSSEVKEYESPEEEGEHEDRNPSSMSVRSVTYAKSNVSKVSQKSKTSAVTCEPSDKNGDEDKCQEEDNESRSVSSMSIHSAKSDISSRSGMSICSSDIPVQQIIARPDSPASTISIKSNSSGVFSDSNPTGERTDKKTSQGRSGSAKSGKSTFSAKSNKSKISAAPTDGSVRDHDPVARQKSNLSIESTTSNVSGTSTKSKASNIPSEHKQDIAASDIEGGGRLSSTETIKSKVSDCSKKSRCSNGASAESIETPNEDDSEEAMQDRAESCTSVKTGCSHASEKAIGSKHSYGRSNDVSSENVFNVTDDDTEEDIERKPLSPISVKSVKTNVSSVSTKSKASRSQRAKEEDQAQRTHSVLSIKSDTSSRTIKSNRSNITPLEGIGNSEDINDSTLDAKPNKLIDPDILTEESEVHNDEEVSEKSEVEERAVSPVSTKTDLSEALSRSEVPSVTIEESEDRSNTATPSKSKTSGRSKKSKTSEIQRAKRARKSESSLSVHSHLSVRSRKTNVTDVSTASVLCESTGEGVTPTEDRAPCLDEEVKEGPTDNKGSKTKRSRGQGTEDEGICPDKHPVICHKDSAESDLSQTLSCSDIMKEVCETSSPGESKSHVSKRIGKGPLEGTDSVSDHSDKSRKHKKGNMDAGDFELVPSILPNASPTEVVNEWLKTLPTERDLYEMEEINENGNGVKDDAAAEEADGSEGIDKNESKAENVKEVNCISNVHNDDCQQSTEAPNEDNICTQREDGSKMLNSSIQVMKVLLNPKLDRCNSLPEISHVYGRKLSTSAKGLLDCLVKLQLIDYDPENANEKNERYQQLMNILQSLWLSEPPEKEHIQNTNDHHSVEGEYNHTSSSGVDVNSGSTGSGKSSDGVKSSNDVNADGSQPQNNLIMTEKAHEETNAEWKLEVEEVNQEEDDRATDETIRSNDSPREAPETPSSSNKSSRGSSCDDKTRSGKQLQDPDPVWVLTLLNKIEKQFMTHYISAMTELKNRWSLKDTDQLDMMIEELKSDVHKKIQISIDREVRKIQGKVGLPRPPNEAIPRVSGKHTGERRRKLKNKLQQSMDSQAEKSDSTGTSYSDQRGENIDEYCPCETCEEKNLHFRTPLSAQVKKTAPVFTDYDLKRILLMKTAIDWTAPCSNDNETITAETLVEKVIVGAIKEVEYNEVDKVRDNAFEFPADETEESNTSQDDQATIKETVNVFAVDSGEEIGKAGDKSPESEIETTSPVEEKMSEVETATEDGTVDAPRGERGSEVNTETVSEDEDEEEVTEIMSSEHKYITASTKELPNQADKVPDDTVEVQSKEESEQEGQCVLVNEASSSKMEGDHEEVRKDWITLKRKLLPSVRIVLQMKTKKSSMMNDENNDTGTSNETVKDQTEEEEIKARVTVLQETTVLSENESSEEAECGEAEDEEHEVSVKQTTDVKSNKEDEEEVEMDEDSLLEMTSNATLSEDENAATETSPTDTSEHGAEKDKIEEQTSVATLTDQRSDMEEAREGTDTTSDHDSVEDSDHTSDGDESQFEKEVTVNELSSIQEEEATEVELSVVSEAELKKKQMTAVGYENVKENKGAESEVRTSEREEVDEESTAEKEETISPVNSDDFPDENEAATADSSEEADEGATTNEMDVKKQVAVPGDQESVNAASIDQESDDEKAKEAGLVNPRQEMDAAEVLKASSATSEDENEESETATSEHKSEKDAAEGEGAGSDKEKLSGVRANDSADEDRVSSTEDESSEEQNEGASTEDDISTEQNGESKDETAADGQHDEVSEEAATVDDGEETDTVGERDSAEDINGTTNDDETAEESDAVSGELSAEHAENDTNDEQDGKEATATATSAYESDESEVAEEEEAVGCKKRPVEVQNGNDQVLTSEAEDGSEEDEINADTTEMESGKDTDGEATSRPASGSEDKTNEENEDKLKEKQSIEATDAEEEDMFKSKSDSAEAFSNDETSVAETKHEINKACNESNEKVPGQTGGEESDVSAEDDRGSMIEGSSRPISENESEEEGNGSAINDEKSESSLRAGTDETTGQEDTSTVRGDDELGDNDSETQSDNEIEDETSQEYSEKNESLCQAESVEQCVSAKESKSSGKVKQSIEDFEEEKKGKDCDTSVVDSLVEDETPLEESESVENESESESKGEDCSEAASKGHGYNKSTDEDLSETQMVGSEITQNDRGERSRSKDAGEGRDAGDKAEIEESADEVEDGSVEEKEPQFTDDQDEDRDAAAAALSDMTLESQEKNNGILKRNSENSSFKDSEKDEDDTDTPHEGWSGSLGDSADGEDEAEEDSEPEEDTNDRQKPFVADKLGSLDATKRAAKKTLQIPLDALIKERAESEDGAYADIEDSETEIHDQRAGASLESKSLKKV